MNQVCLQTIAFALGLLIASGSIAQENSPPERNFGFNSKLENAYPANKPPLEARQNLGAFVRDNSRAVALVGNKNSGFGSAWVLSKRHRLLVTNAHVADFYADDRNTEAILNGTPHRYQIQKIWYHPGVRRYPQGDTHFSIRSDKCSDGPIDPMCPDLAVLQLVSEGPDLNDELKLATPQELSQLLGQPAAIFGFPSHDTFAWPDPDEKPSATFHDGSISRLTDFGFRADAPAEELQFVQYSMATWSGFSGSPVILSNGHVAAVHNMSRPIEKAKDVRFIAHGVRIDCVWELLVHHGLDTLVEIPVPKENLRISHWLKKDEMTELLEKANDLIGRAKMEATMQLTPGAGLNLCNEAIRLAPFYPLAYHARAYCYRQRFLLERQTLPRNTALEALNAIRLDLEKYIELTGGSDPFGMLDYIRWGLEASVYTKNPDLMKECLAATEKFLSGMQLTPNQASNLLRLRGELHSALDQLDLATVAFTKAIVTDPDNSLAWKSRSEHLAKLGKNAAAEQDRLMADKVLLAFFRNQAEPPRSSDQTILRAEGRLPDAAQTTLNSTQLKLDLEAGYTYVIEMRSNDFNSALELHDPRGRLVARDDDGLGGPDSRIIFTAEEMGAFRLNVMSVEPKPMGSYQVRVVRLGKKLTR